MIKKIVEFSSIRELWSTTIYVIADVRGIPVHKSRNVLF